MSAEIPRDDPADIVRFATGGGSRGEGNERLGMPLRNLCFIAQL